MPNVKPFEELIAEHEEALSDGGFCRRQRPAETNSTEIKRDSGTRTSQYTD
jgi:hypothetical protein